jgi:2-polyprenyl-3-methyl-5-hydroxy-6-metoxy-1,4-benzoquinol methylase
MTDTYQYVDLPRREVLAFLPPGAHRILDVGCGRGGFGREVKLNRAAEVWGIEQVPEAAAMASEHYDRVVVGEYPAALEDLARAEGEVRQFDCLVFNDVLEHMVDPWETLRRSHRWLRPGGHVLASIPNIRHYTVLIDLVLRGRWTYTAAGILDRTHLRFFTRKTMADLFADTGYEVECVAPVNFCEGRLPALLSLVPGSVGIRCAQFVVRARSGS